MTDIPEKAREILQRISECVQRGKADINTNIPPGSKGQPGVAEYTEQAIELKLSPQTILDQGLSTGMGILGKKFARNEVFIPEVLIAARAMHAGMNKLKPLFAKDDVPARGVFVIGTVQGDLHDIGKNLVCMMVEGAGWQVVDLGVDCKVDKYVEAVQANPGCIVGLSALLTTTMVAMKDAVSAIRAVSPDTPILVGGAPVTDDFAKEIGATAYARDPSAAIDVLNRIKPAA